MAVFNPFEALNPRVSRGATAENGNVLPEEAGFVKLFHNPAARANEPDAEVVYFPRARDGRLLSRRRVSIGLKILTPRRGRESNRPYGRAPYSYEFQSVPAGRGLDPYETLRLYVDRDVQILLPEQAQQILPRSNFLIPFEQRGFFPTPRTLRLEVVRLQLQSQVPQSPTDAFALAARPRVWEAWVPRVLGEGTASQLSITRSEGPTGTSLTFVRTDMGLGRGAGSRTTVLGRLKLDYANIRLPGAYHVRVTVPDADRRGARSRLQVHVTISHNIYAELSVQPSDSVAGNLLDDLLDFSPLHGAPLFDNVDLYMGRVPRNRWYRVPRPGSRRTGATQRVDSATPSYVRARRRHSSGGLTGFDIVEFGIGFVPIIGDLYDLGVFAYALATGEDLVGRRLDDWELVLMGLAALPGIPSSAHHLSSAIASRQAQFRPMRRRLLEQLRVHRPRLAAALARGDGDAALAALLADAPASRGIALGQIRDEAVLEALSSSAS